MDLLSIVVPALNEEGNVAALHEALMITLQHTDSLELEVVYVNDGSTDGTRDEIIDLMQRDPRVRLVDLVRSFGHEVALTAGMDYAHGDAIVFMDADHQHPPSLVPEMVKLWRSGKDVVYTRRHPAKERSWVRHVGRRLFHCLLRLVGYFGLPEGYTDFRLVDRRVVRVLTQMNERDRLFRGLLGWVGARRWAVVEFNAPPRRSGKSKYTVAKLAALAVDGIVQSSVIPLRLSTALGLMCAAIAVVLGIVTTTVAIFGDYHRTGYATILLTVIFLGSVQLLALGIIGEYLGRVYLEVKKRPLYIAEYHATPDTLTGRGLHGSRASWHARGDKSWPQIGRKDSGGAGK